MVPFEQNNAGHVLSQCDNHATLNGTKGTSNTIPAGNGDSHWAGAQRPKTCSGDDGHPEDTNPPASPTKVFTRTQRASSLQLKLRQQAARQGMKPGSPRWRAYVLGTAAAAAKRRKRKKEDKCL